MNLVTFFIFGSLSGGIRSIVSVACLLLLNFFLLIAATSFCVTINWFYGQYLLPSV